MLVLLGVVFAIAFCIVYMPQVAKIAGGICFCLALAVGAYMWNLVYQGNLARQQAEVERAQQEADYRSTSKAAPNDKLDFSNLGQYLKDDKPASKANPTPEDKLDFSNLGQYLKDDKPAPQAKPATAGEIDVAERTAAQLRTMAEVEAAHAATDNPPPSIATPTVRDLRMQEALAHARAANIR